MTTINEQIAGTVMAEIVRRHEDGDPIIDLVTLWEVVEITANVAVRHLTSEGNLPLDLIARANPTVMSEIKAGKKIQAIKELRVVSRSGLKEAKEAVDKVWQEGWE